METWENYSCFQASLYDGRQTLQESIKNHLHELCDELTSPKDKLAKVYEYFGKITRYVSIQLGIGGVATAVGYGLMNKNDLGCHTEMMSDSIMALMKAGVINNSRPKFIPRRTVVGFAFGSRALYEYLDHNEKVWFGPFPVVNNPANIAKNDNMISINTAMSIDLFGQVAAEGVGGNQFSGTGGQGDYVRGAQLAKGGKSFLAFKSTLGTDKDGSPISRIVPTFPPATIVTTPRSDVQYVVTEYGSVNLKHFTVKDRAKALIDLAHPDCRAELTAQAKAMGLL